MSCSPPDYVRGFIQIARSTNSHYGAYARAAIIHATHGGTDEQIDAALRSLGSSLEEMHACVRAGAVVEARRYVDLIENAERRRDAPAWARRLCELLNSFEIDPVNELDISDEWVQEMCSTFR